MTQAPQETWLSYFSRGHVTTRKDVQTNVFHSLPLNEGPGLHQVTEAIGDLIEYVTALFTKRLVDLVD